MTAIRLRRLLALSVAALATSPVVALAHRTTAPCAGVVTTIVDDGTQVLYIDDRTGGATDVNHWIYLESNTHPGLQSGGDNVVLADIDADPCFTTHKSGPGKTPDALLL
jgi:hypothetical protein